MKLSLYAWLAGAVAASGQLPAPTAAGATPLTVALPPQAQQAVSVQAVMMPYAINRELFSKHIADNYAVVLINIGNRSHDAALVLQGVYLDYSNWALSGSVPRATAFGGHALGTTAGQVSAVEYRIVRGELEERDAKSVRNWIMRSLEFAGSVAGGTTFVYGALSNVPKYMSMASGVGIPGLEKLWPDSLITRLNRISDFGYRVNRTVPRESSDVMIAFFPIERFLTPKLKHIFVKQPALFFNTGLALVDPNPEMTAILERVSGRTLAELTAQIPAMLDCASGGNKPGSCDQSKGLRELVRSTSLNSIEVVIDGNMMLDLSTIGPLAETVVFQQLNDAAGYWGVPGTGKGVVVTGRFLDGARVMVEPALLGVEWIAGNPAQSSSDKLVGTLRFNKAIPPGQALSIRVVKDGKDGQSLASAALSYAVDYVPVKSASAVIQPNVAGRQLNLVGIQTPFSLALSRTKPAPAGPVLLTSNSSGMFDLTTLAAGCYDGTLFHPGASALSQQVMIAPAPVITKATRIGNTVKLEGSDLFALASDCSLAPVAITVLDGQGALTGLEATRLSAVDPKGAELTFDFPFPEHTANWQVQVTGSKPAPIQ